MDGMVFGGRILKNLYFIVLILKNPVIMSDIFIWRFLMPHCWHAGAPRWSRDFML